MNKKIYVFVMACFYPMMMWAARYEDPFEAFFVGAMSWVVFVIIVFFGRWLIKTLKKTPQQVRSALNDSSSYIESGTTFVKRPSVNTNNSTQSSGIQNYKSIKDDLLEKCSPENFMQPYDYLRVKEANKLYPTIIQCDENDIDQLLSLRKIATNNLGVSFPTNDLYVEVCKVCDPRQYMNPYNPEKLEIANDLYSRATLNKYDNAVLEKLLKEARHLQQGIVSADDSSQSEQEDRIELGTGTFVVLALIIIAFVAMAVMLNG